MIKSIKILLLVATVATLSACGWHFKNNEVLPQELRTLAFESADEHSDISRTLRQQLQLNDVTLVKGQENIAKLRLVNASSSSKVVSKLLSLTVQVIIEVPNKGAYPLEVSVHRTFFDDSRAALAKSAEQEMIMRDMYQQASRQLIIKMAGLHKELNQQK